ncbi:efflux RND transporter periplasmic adaptor subunit [Microbacterium rhizophilus]|uniref:efflux RND transporter periplasmic adaptor subunit n=1 Tax=Microbacterium rhizophilus TaxID=3138934 RepID=UPI0031EE6E54
MAVFRRVLLPVFWLAIGAVAAVALAKLAFFPDQTVTPGIGAGAEPTGALSEPQVPVERGTIVNDLELPATVSNDPAVAVTAFKAGVVVDVFAAEGKQVQAGAILASVREQVSQDDGSTFDLWSEIVAPATGTLSELSLAPGQAIAPADVVGAVAPATFRIQGTIAPADRYRLSTEPTEAQVAIAGGPAPFTCTGLVLETPLAGLTAESAEGPTSTTVRCPVPDGVRVFPGLGATITLSGGVAEDVLVVPMTAVLGSNEAGVVYVPGPDGTPEQREVVLGLNDGEVIEVREGLDEGEPVLEFVPVTPAEGDETTAEAQG